MKTDRQALREYERIADNFQRIMDEGLRDVLEAADKAKLEELYKARFPHTTRRLRAELKALRTVEDFINLAIRRGGAAKTKLKR